MERGALSYVSHRRIARQVVFFPSEFSKTALRFAEICFIAEMGEAKTMWSRVCDTRVGEGGGRPFKITGTATPGLSGRVGCEARFLKTGVGETRPWVRIPPHPLMPALFSWNCSIPGKSTVGRLSVRVMQRLLSAFCLRICFAFPLHPPRRQNAFSCLLI